ncbi:heterokaryon incompatibility protein-domain-containing protein [Xylariaceae sp. AK1471]|nr:heterokaryon incompatibility protein-domain-containing protein [Xylariaceae sp. AK1471]
MSWEHPPSAYPSNEIISSTNQPLCQRCSNINFGRIRPSRIKSRQAVIWLGPASEIVKDTTCCMCQVFDQTFQQRPSYKNGLKYCLYPFCTSSIHADKWVYSHKLEGTVETVSFAIIDEWEFWLLENGGVRNLKDTIKTCGWISPLSILNPSYSFNPRKLGSDIDFGVVKGWLEFCTLNHHKSCARVPGRSMLPIKLIDCASRTIITAVPGHPYLALSYVWGCPSITESDYRPGAERSSLPKLLPKVIEDAIIVTKKLGFQYLWIDRYCIDQQDAKDKAAQIKQMDLIYSLASCTIIAAVGDDPTAGLPGVSTTDRKPRSSAITRDGGYYISVPPDPVSKINDSTWNSRGWTFQEAILSRRRLVFCDDQVYFSCGGMACRDAMDIPLTTLHRKDMQRFRTWNDDWNDLYNDTHNDKRLFGPIIQVRYPLHECSKLIKSYTKRSMSDPNDILYGILGVLKRFQAVHKLFRQFYGIILVPDTTFIRGEDGDGRRRKLTKETNPSSYTEQLATGLGWDVDRSANPDQSGQRRHGFPSWSWTGWTGQLKAPTEYEGYILNTHMMQIRVEDRHGNVIDWEDHCRRNPTDEDLGNVNMHLHIEATFVDVSLHYSATDPCRTEQPNQGHDKVWWALLEREDKTLLSTPFTLTRKEEDARHSFYDKLKAIKWPGLILGKRCGTSYIGTLQRVRSSDPAKLVLMIVDNAGSGIAERIGLATFQYDVELGGIPTCRRSILLG